MFDPHWRHRSLHNLDEPFDVVVIGGGITGCGVFFDASQRGLRTLLVERDDIASGTSSRSSKLVHGGLRYLKQMHFRVTRQASRERDRMSVLNPELVEPMRFVYPANKGDALPSWQVDLGLWMYDRLTRRPDKHRHLDMEDLARMVPGLATEELDQAFSYGDSRTDDARLTLAVAATGYAFGGHLLTRAEVLDLTRNRKDRIDGVVIKDAENGASHEVKSHVVVNAAGVWVDDLRAHGNLGEPRVRPSRGVHIILPTHRLPVQAAAMVPAADDGRPVFLIPHPEGVIVGTTDIYHNGSRRDPRPTQAEVSYLIRTLAAHFPGNRLSDQDILGVFAGLRPILDSHTDNPSEASREEDIWEEAGMVSVAGGKLTTWRPTAEETVDEVIRFLPEERARRAARCYTAGTPLVGFGPRDLAQRVESLHRVTPEVAAGLARRLRSWSLTAPEHARERADLQPILDGSDLTPCEVRWHLRHGAITRLQDLLLRRTRIAMWRPELASALAPLLQAHFAETLNWDTKRWDRELQDFHNASEAWAPAGVIE